jgi:hypothetical protein
MIKTPGCRVKCAEPVKVICPSKSAQLSNFRLRSLNKRDTGSDRKEEGHGMAPSLLLACVCSLSVITITAAPGDTALASDGDVNGSHEDASPLIQRLLERTEEKREERKLERLRDYYRRNYRDYFSFQSRNMKSLSPETQQEIRKWLHENGESQSSSKTVD